MLYSYHLILQGLNLHFSATRNLKQTLYQIKMHPVYFLLISIIQNAHAKKTKKLIHLFVSEGDNSI